MTPLLPPTGYVYPLSHIAETVKEDGVTNRYELKLHANVTSSFEAILKYDVAV